VREKDSAFEKLKNERNEEFDLIKKKNEITISEKQLEFDKLNSEKDELAKLKKEKDEELDRTKEENELILSQLKNDNALEFDKLKKEKNEEFERMKKENEASIREKQLEFEKHLKD